MEAIITSHLEGIKFGEIQTHKHVSVMPMLSNNGSGPVYLTMKEAIESGLLTVTEVSEGGHVPELKVINRADKPVLLIDGEELIGAKQNRVLNTTILLKEKSETVIPVSCTEHGRWIYKSGHFEESAYMMSATLRNIKNVSVSYSLHNTGAFASDQGAVWDGISDQAEAAGVHSKTGAMRDIHEARKEDLDDWLEHFPPVAEQKGLLVMVNGKVVGLDMVSDTGAFRVIYPKLVRSYLMDAILEKPGKGKTDINEKAKSFMSKILTCTEKRYDSVGHGQDYRYEGKKIVGSALIHKNTVIHMAFFGITEAEKSGPYVAIIPEKDEQDTINAVCDISFRKDITMIGAIAGDIIGSVYEWNNIKTKEFELFSARCFFTDDTVLTVALAYSILTDTRYVDNLKKFYHLYPDSGYGGGFHRWAKSVDSEPYNSWGNGAAMRISSVGYAYDNLDTVLQKAAEFTEITHNHPEGIKGGQATAAAIFLARKVKSKDEIKDFIETEFQYDLSKHVDEIRPSYRFNESSQETVPQAIRAFIDSTGFEDAIRTAVSLGGDTDTLACITGGIAQGFYGGVPDPIANKVYDILDKRLGKITREFMEEFCS